MTALVALVVAVVPFVVAVPAAYAGVGFGVTPTFPVQVLVGATGLPASIQISNSSTTPENGGNVTITAINLVPSCGTTATVGFGNCPAVSADPNVFQLSATATGETGTACAGTTFTVTIIDPSTGQVTFTAPVGSPVVLTPPGMPGSICVIDFTFNVLKAPTKPDGLSPPGTVDTDQIGFASGQAVVNGKLGSGTGSSGTRVLLATPGLTTTATTTTTIGGSITDTAHLLPSSPPGPAPTGTITFRLFNTAGCTGAAIFTSTVTVNGTGDYTSAAFTPTGPGTYRWIAAYSGDGNYVPATTACGDNGETSTVNQATPAIVTVASAPVIIGGPISDSATLSGGFSPTGTITFTVFGPNNPTCTGAAVFTSTVTVVGNGAYSSGPFTPTAPGPYNFVAAYSGDANNVAVTSPCGAPNETATVNRANPTIVTTASAPVNVGGTISDSAVLAGGVAPTGTITFTVFGPANPTCTGTPVFTSSTTVAGNGTYSSASFTTTLAGTYQFVASYSGDANNNPVVSPCGAPNESVVVSKANPTIVTTASPTVKSGGSISDTATLAGGQAPTGTITFTLFGPANPTCTGVPIFTSTVPVSGNGVYPSGPFTVTATGTYQWIAAYSGDANNAAAMSGCGAANESVVVTPATPTIVTTASPSVAAGNPITDTATLAGGSAPTGTITFTVFGPNNPTCTGTPAFTSTVPVNAGNGNYTSAPFTPNLAGTYQFVAAYSGDANNQAVTSPCGAPNESVVVTPATPTIVTQASPPVAAGGSVTDTATLAGGINPTGTITFTLFGPNNATCTGAPIFTSVVPVNAGNGNYTSAPPFTVTAAGTYRWVAVYSGDANNAAVTSGCNAPNESVVVNPAIPAIVTQASAPVAAGGNISDTATLSGGVNPTGTITFTVFGPNNATCAGPPAFTSMTSVTGNGSYPSGNFTAVLAGTYRFVAAYSGDANNVAVTTLCNDPNESVVVAPANPAIVTTASASVPVGGTISDTAVLSGGVNPTGTITFTLFGPNNSTCTGTAIFTSTATVTGNGSYPSGPFTTTAPGTYRFVAVYSGDANNASVTSPCNAPNESVVVTQATPAIVTTASSSVPAGGTISDTAVLSGGVSPTGTITFTLFGPNNAACTGPAIFTSTKTVTGNGSYTSDPFTTVSVGVYRFVAVYSGDANNVSVTSPCGAANESVTVTPAVPAIVTHASPSVAVGGSIADTATLSGGTSPTGTITFTLFGPNNPTCTGTPIFTSTRTVTGNGDYTSAPFTTSSVGTYQFVAVYSGDANNAAAMSPCGAANESVVVTPTAPTIVTVASPSIPAGGTISDTATLAGGVNPTGTITFTLFGPNNGTCTGLPAFTSTQTVNGNGAYTSGLFTATAAGTYRFVAAYSGDANNAAVTTACNDANESVVVTPAGPTIVTTASAPVKVGNPISDIALLSGGVAPTGTITFTVFGPNNATCTGAAAFTSTVTVAGNGSYPSGPFTPTAAGTYRFVAAYSGDANNSPAGPTLCNDPAESVVVSTTNPSIATQASAPTIIGGTISDTASLTGGAGPTGTITFTVFGPNNATCTGIPAFTSTVPVAGNGNYLSGPFTPTAPGTYRFVAVYSGDANNAAAGPTACNDPAEAVVVSTANPTIVTAASPSVPVGGNITDTATLAGGVNPTGTITFQVFGPNNNTCAGIPAFTSTKAVAGNGNYTSAPFATPASGTYRFVATYSGDANNSPAGPTACLDPAEVSSGTNANPALATTVSAAVAVGAAINDTAILTGGFNPTGTITFALFGPNNATCAGTPVFTATRSVNGNGNYASAPFTPTAPGSYTFVATYSGDANNNAAGPTACNDPAETVIVSPSAVSLTTTASAQADVGQPIFDTATLVGTNPTGTITFNLFGPNNATCTGTPVFTSIKPVNGSGTYTSAQFTPTAPGTYVFVATYSGDANNVPTGPTSCSDPLEAVLVLPRPQIAVTKVANPLSRPEPGGTFTFTITVSNPSPIDPVKITSLVDNIYGDLATRPGSTCGTLIGVTLAPGATSPPCSFTGPFTGHGGDSQTDTVTVVGVDTQGIVVTATAQATVTLTVIAPSISVTKAASPPTRVEPGGNFTFTVTVTNTNPVDPVTITSLVDNIYGNLATRAGSTCGSLIGLTLAPGATSPPCSFTGPFNGVAGDSQTDTVTVTGMDSHGTTVTATAQATVSLTPITPEIALTKVANPLSLPAPGGTFTFTVQVRNPSTVDPVKITSLVDNIYGDLATRAGSTCGVLIGVTLAPGATSAPCTFTGPFTGNSGDSQTDTVTVTGVDTFGHTVTAVAQATVTLTPPAAVPVISLTKVANPLSLPVPGGTFTFTVRVTNPSTTIPIKITSLVDNIYGDLATRTGSTCGALIGVTLAPGATSAPCSFTGPFTGKAGDSQTDTVTVTGVDSNGVTATATAKATVTLTTVLPAINVTKSANPLLMAAPGGFYTFTVTVINTSSVVPVKITSLVDDIYGDLATRANSTCGTLIGVTLAPGATSAPCSFTVSYMGSPGFSQTDTVTATGTDSQGNKVTATAKATIGLTGSPPGPLALTGLDGRRPVVLAVGMILLGMMLVAAVWWRRRRTAD